MKTYEALIIFPPQTGGLDGKNTFDDLVKKYDGKVSNRIEIGRRFLGYTVKKVKEGFFASFEFELAPGKMSELRRSLDLSEDVLKYTIVVKEPKKQAVAK